MHVFVMIKSHVMGTHLKRLRKTLLLICIHVCFFFFFFFFFFVCLFFLLFFFFFCFFVFLFVFFGFVLFLWRYGKHINMFVKKRLGWSYSWEVYVNIGVLT